MMQEKALDAIIRAINHPERRQIINILKNQSEGVRYTALLGETRLTTAKLNYQLNELDGLIQKTSDGLYTLTELGRRAAAILDNIENNLQGDLELEPIIDNTRREKIKKTTDYIFTAIMIIYSIVPLILTYFYLAEPAANIPVPLIVLSYLIIGAFIVGLNYARKKFPHLIYGLYEIFNEIVKGITHTY
jgi:DNA-binding HxlR family transcriptional regulator